MSFDSPEPRLAAERAPTLTSPPAEWPLLVALDHGLRRVSDPVELQQVATRLLGELLGANRVTCAEIAGNEFVVRCSYLNGVAPLAERGSLAFFGEPVLDAFGRGETIAVGDVGRDGRFTAAERGRLLDNEIAAFVAVLLRRGDALAAFYVDAATPRSWSPEQIHAIETVAERTWSAAEHAATEAALASSAGRLTFLARLTNAIRPLRDPQRIAVVTCRLLGLHLAANRVIYNEIDGEHCTIVDDYVDGVASMAGRWRWMDLTGDIVNEFQRDGVLVVTDTQTDPRTASVRDALKAVEVGAYLMPPLIKDDRFVGTFAVHSRTPRVWTEDEIVLSREVADRVSLVLEQRRAEAALRAAGERLTFLLRLNDALQPLNDPSDIQETAARLLGEYLTVTRVGYAEIDEGGYHIRREYAHGVAPLLGQGSGGTFGAALRDAYRRGDTVVVSDVRTDPRFTDDERLGLQARQIESFVGVTLLRNGRLVAAFGANHATARTWTPVEIELIRDVAVRTWDAVERTRAEAEVREREQRLRLALDASAGGSWTWDARTNQVDWDDRFRALYGFPLDQPPESAVWMERVHEDDRAQVQALLSEMMGTSREAWDNTFRFVRADGSLAWVQSLGRAERDSDGRVTRLTGLDLDVTVRRQAEEALRARRDEEHDRELRLLLETATQGIVSVDARGTIVSANRALETMFGWQRGELVGESIDRLLPTSLRDEHAQHRAEYLAAPQPRAMGADRELVGQRRDGRTFPIEVTLNHVGAPGEGRVFAFVTDTTERQRAAAALQERTAELERRTLQLSRMASELTLAEQHAREEIAKTLHDGLQQLLVIASMNLEQQATRDKERGSAPNELLAQAADHLAQAIAAARSLSVDLFPPVLQHAGLPAALTWLANWTQQKYGLAVNVTVDPRADSPRRDVRTLLFESARELLFNAVKHAQIDRVSLGLGLTSDGGLCITVTDQGIGFDPAKLVAASEAGPIGWGLFSIRERLTLLGGRLRIESTPGQGARFELIAPLASAAAALEQPDLEPHAAAGRTSVGEGSRPSVDALRILIVDDHAGVRKVLRETLHRWRELRVVGEAANGLEAIVEVEALGPDVVLMDISMPLMDGIDATRQLRAAYPSVRIFGLSMQQRPDGRHPIEEAGAAGFFVKGVDTQRLIDQLLEVHAARRVVAE
jgi:PAS domain S-box-containing protein